MLELLVKSDHTVHQPQIPQLLLSRDVRYTGSAATRVVADRRAAALLALLAVEGNVWAYRATAMLWPARTVRASDALVSLRAALTQLCGAELVVGNELLRLEPAVRARIGPCDEELDALALAVAAPELLAGFIYRDLPEFEHWLAATRRRLRRFARAACIDAAREHEQHNDLSQALRAARRALAVDPHCEDSLRLFMLLSVRAGRHADALAAFERSNASMRQHHGASLSVDTRLLADEITRVACASNEALTSAARRR